MTVAKEPSAPAASKEPTKAKKGAEKEEEELVITGNRCEADRGPFLYASRPGLF